LVAVFQSFGHEAIHTLELPMKNATPDEEIIRYAAAYDCIVTTKDADFVDAFYLRGQPERLLLISTGNIKNRDLESLLQNHLAAIADLFVENYFVELTRADIIAHS
jgi:predicted nuclease of predicted toxin-antitoxin system